MTLRVMFLGEFFQMLFYPIGYREWPLFVALVSRYTAYIVVLLTAMRYYTPNTPRGDKYVKQYSICTILFVVLQVTMGLLANR